MVIGFLFVCFFIIGLLFLSFIDFGRGAARNALWAKRLSVSFVQALLFATLIGAFLIK
ncbi:hypothetical protein [Gordoniibacillus kamchatkensis]|uniref:hypothetical protein n=1 Tax=Gordoniibacillus kamchatkensis TaxID=1590651 RepID=UPI000B21533B|nr:hypothetical protein [Paenibacillus sp. VKM B-2647]